MANVTLSSCAPFLGKTVKIFSIIVVSLLLSSGSTIPVNGQVADTEELRNRLIDVTKGLNAAALRRSTDDANFNSYQSKAFFRLSQQVGVNTFTDAKIAQYYALYCIYSATNAVANEITNDDVRFQNITMPGWFVATNWWNETNVDPCGTTIITLANGTSEVSATTTLTAKTFDGWHGVSCDAEGRIVALELYDNILTGKWPVEIVLLSSDGPFSTGAGNLKKLDLYENEFLSNGGNSSWMSDLGSNMTTIIVEGTSFSGDIPVLPKNLINFNIRNAFYTGGFADDKFILLSQLNYLNLDGNMFNASIPALLSELPDLEYVYMSDSFLTGDLSPLEGSSAMKEFWADGNPGLTGPLYSWLGNITTLASVSLAYNNLTGSVPIEIGNLIKMEQMWLQNNNLSGTVPTELGKLVKLHHLELESNAFTGFVLASICQRTEFPQTLKTLGADCFDDNFFCPCCTCCDVIECLAGITRSPTTR